MDRMHRRSATFFTMVGLGLSIMAALALLSPTPFAGQIAPLLALIAGVTIAIRFGWAAYTGNIPTWMARFFEMGDPG